MKSDTRHEHRTDTGIREHSHRGGNESHKHSVNEQGFLLENLPKDRMYSCVNCGHDIDNHSYKGCLVEKCDCKLRPSQVCNV